VIRVGEGCAIGQHDRFARAFRRGTLTLSVSNPRR
jgi:hypothetical protein